MVYKRKMKENINAKTEKLKDIMNKTIGLQSLVKRNKENAVKNEENLSVLNFPFIILENKSDSQVKILKSLVKLI